MAVFWNNAQRISLKISLIETLAASLRARMKLGNLKATENNGKEVLIITLEVTFYSVSVKNDFMIDSTDCLFTDRKSVV